MLSEGGNMVENTCSNRKERMSLKKGEQQRPNGTFAYRWTDSEGERQVIYAPTLEELRNKEKDVVKDQLDGIKTEARFVTINEMYECWKQLKRGLRDNTFQNYQFMYNQYVAPRFGKRKISALVKSDVKRFYNMLADERELSMATIDCVHTVLHQVLDMAVEDCYIRKNPADNVLKELRLSHNREEKRRPLTLPEQTLFLDYLKNTEKYQHWYPVFAVMIGTGLRVGEVVGLRWQDIDLDEGFIDVNHTLIYYRHEVNGCYCNIHPPKTFSSIRKIPMLDFVKDAFQQEKQYQQGNGICCKAVVNGYTDFIFVNRFGDAQHQGTLNKALRRIVRDCNDEVLLKGRKNPTLLPYFSCHILRHTFATRMCEAGVNVKVIQDTLGHSDVRTTLNIYADATKDLKRKEFHSLETYWNDQRELKPL